MIRTLFFLCVLVSAIAIGADTGSYDIQHAFRVNVSPKPGQMFRGEWHWGLQTIAKNHTFGNDSKLDYSNSSFTNTGSGFRTLSSSVNQASANANAQFQFNADGTGFHRGWGNYSLGWPNGKEATTYSNTTVKVQVGTTGQNGTVYWNPTWFSDTINGNAHKIRDPVDVFTLNRLTNEVRSARLFDVLLDLPRGGTSSFQDGVLHLRPIDGSFSIMMADDGLVGPHGGLNTTFADGIVTSSDAFGIWSHLAPAPGSSADLDLQLCGPNGFELQYDLGSSVPEGFDTEFHFGGGGQIDAVPEPGTALAMTFAIAALLRRKRLCRTKR